MPSHKRGGSRPWRRMVATVLRRDNGICWICGQPGADTADHLLPRALGGPDTLDNLRAAHHNTGPRCNRIRSDRMDVATVRAEIAAAQTRTTPTPNTWNW